MSGPERPNFNLVESFMGKDVEDDILETVMKESLAEIDAAKNKETKRKTTYWIKKLEDEAKKIGIRR